MSGQEQVVVAVHNLHRTFGTKVALANVSLDIRRGGVYGLVGGNGAGKTTLIRHILGLFTPQAGSVMVFGINPVVNPPAVLSRIGFLAEDRDIPGWMRVHELLSYTRAFYPDWDPAFAEELRDMFELPPGQKVQSLSRGQIARAGLLLALAHRPELLVLDEPSSGLDPVVRRDILSAIIRTVADEGRTVLFSSHLLDEVERVADRVAMLHAGRIVLDESLEQLKSKQRIMTLRFAVPQSAPPILTGAIPLNGAGKEWTCVCEDAELVRMAAGSLGVEVIGESAASLEEIFMARSSKG